MEALLSLLPAYGQFGVMLWLVFEVRDVRRWLKTHIEVYHRPEETRSRHGDC